MHSNLTIEIQHSCCLLMRIWGLIKIAFDSNIKGAF